MNRETRKRLVDAKMTCERIIHYVEGQTAESYLANEALQLIVERLLITVGEAINVAIRQADGSLTVEGSSQIIGLRNRIVHGYDDIKQEIIWDTAVTDMPVLLAHLDELLEGSAKPFDGRQ